MKKYIATLLCAAMLLALVVGCGGVSDPPETYYPEMGEPLIGVEVFPDDEEPENGNDFEHENDSEPDHECFVIDFLGAFYYFAPETVMMTIGDITVTWEELFFGLHIAVMTILEQLGEITDWYQVFADDMTLAEAALSMGQGHILRFKSIDYGAALLGVTLSEQDLNFIQMQIEAFTEQFGGEDEFMEFLWFDSGVRSESMFEYILQTSLLIDVIREAIFGLGGELLTDEMADEFFSERDDGFMMAKHILIQFGDDPEDATQRADEIWGRLNAYTGDDIELYFDELMFEYSEDPGLASFPQGYLFQFFDMVPEFSQGTYELEIGQFSEPIETVHGYHIIFRVPLDFDQIPFSFMHMGRNETLRGFAAMNLFSEMLGNWYDALEPVFSDEFNSIVISEIFLPC